MCVGFGLAHLWLWVEEVKKEGHMSISVLILELFSLDG